MGFWHDLFGLSFVTQLRAMDEEERRARLKRAERVRLTELAARAAYERRRQLVSEWRLTDFLPPWDTLSPSRRALEVRGQCAAFEALADAEFPPAVMDEIGHGDYASRLLRRVLKAIGKDFCG